MIAVLRKVRDLLLEDPPYRWVLLLVLAVLVSVLEILGAFSIFLLLGLIVGGDDISGLPFAADLQEAAGGPGSTRFFVTIACVIGGFFLLRGATYLIQTYAQNRVAHNSGARLAARLLRGYLSVPYSFHLQRSSSGPIRNLQQSTYEVVTYVYVPLVGLFSEGLIVLGITAVLLFSAPAVTVAAVAIIGVLVLILMRFVQPRLGVLGEINQENTRLNLQVIQHSLEGIREIKLLGRASFFHEKFIETRRKVARAFYMRAVLTDLPRVALETTLILLVLLLFITSKVSGQSSQELLTILGLFAYGLLRMLPSVNRVITYANTLKFGLASLNNIHADLSIVRFPDRIEDDSTAQKMSFEGEIRFREVSFRYPGASELALRDIDLSIARGEAIGIVGSTGAGKSTLIDVMVGLLEATEGRVEVDGIRIQDRLTAWQRSLGMVSQSVFLLDDTIRQNIIFGEDDVDVDEERLASAIETAQLPEFVRGLPDQLQTIVGERGVRLSGGQRQRIAIARALYHHPQVVVFDEGTSALDTVTELALMTALQELREKCTFVVVAHRISTVRNCDRIALMTNGEVVAVAPYEELRSTNQEFRHLAG
jgi:ATP-binding cassette subfamily C protein